MGRELTARQILEKKKYTDCFLNGTTHSNQYGEGNHGVNAVPFFEEQNVKSTIDIGAGQGVFVNNLVNNGKLNLETVQKKILFLQLQLSLGENLFQSLLKAKNLIMKKSILKNFI